MRDGRWRAGERNAGQRSHRGFTLIESIVSLALVAALMTLAAPGFVQYQRNSELTALTNTLLATIHAAKSEAMKTGKNAFVAPMDADWNSGWVVFVDVDRDNAYTDGVDITVRQQAAPPAYFNVTGNNTAAGSAPYIKFNGSGYSVRNRGAGPVALSLSIARTDVPRARVLEETRRIVVARTGRVRSCKPGANSRSCGSTTQ